MAGNRSWKQFYRVNHFDAPWRIELRRVSQATRELASSKSCGHHLGAARKMAAPVPQTTTCNPVRPIPSFYSEIEAFLPSFSGTEAPAATVHPTFSNLPCRSMLRLSFSE